MLLRSFDGAKHGRFHWRTENARFNIWEGIMEKIAILLGLASFSLVSPAFAMSHMMSKTDHMCMMHGKKVHCVHHRKHHVMHHTKHHMNMDTKTPTKKKI
jgi:hypothetical protein